MEGSKMPTKKLNKILGTARTPNMKKLVGNLGSTPWGARDSDGDKVMNSLDCEPYNKYKQGVVHDMRMKLLLRKQRKTAQKARESEQRSAVKQSIARHETQVAEEKEIKPKKKVQWRNLGYGFKGASVQLSAIVVPRRRTTKKRRKIRRKK